MTLTLRRLTPLFPAILVTVLSACAIFGEQPPTQFFVLTSIADRAGEATAAPAAAAAGPEVGVGIAPVEIPDYLQRREIITRSSGNALVVNRFYQWASPLNADFERVLAADLGTLLPTRRAVVLPFRRAFTLDYEVRMSVDRFERLPDGTVALDARWVIIGQQGEKALAIRDARIRIPDVADRYPDVVEAMSRAVAELAGDVADDIRALRATSPSSGQVSLNHP
jgi:uncharacterized lipoprotein YmbA